MSILSQRWYTEKAVKKINTSDLTTLVVQSNGELKKTGAIDGNYELNTIFNPELQAIEGGAPLPPSFAAQGLDAEGKPLFKIPFVFIPLTSANPTQQLEGPLESSSQEKSVNKINSALNTLANDFRKNGGEIYHFVIKVPTKELLEKHWENKYALFSTEAFVTEISSGNMIQLLKSKTLDEFVEYERSKVEEVGKILNLEPVDILSLNIAANRPVPALYNNLLEQTLVGPGVFTSGGARYSWVMTPRWWASTGNASAGALMYFETFLFINPTVADALNVLREDAGPKKPDPKKLKKVDDPEATFLNELAQKYPAERLQDQKAITDARPTASTFGRVIQRARSRVERVNDTAITRMLLNIDKIETIQDVFTYVYDILPISQMLQIAADCILSRIDFEWDSVVCEVIMSGIQDFEGDQTVKDIMAYTNINVDKNVIAENFKRLVIDEFFKEYGDPALEAADEDLDLIPDAMFPQFKQFLLELYNRGSTTKNVICAMILAAGGAAVVLMIILIKDEVEKAKKAKEVARKRSKDASGNSGKKLEEFFKKIISSPADELLEQIESGVKNHPILSFTENFVENFNTGIILLIEQICVRSVTYILKEIAALCEDSAAADYSNAPSGVEGIRSNNLDNSFITDPTVYNNLFNFIYERAPDLTIDQELLASFFNDIGALLTISELCFLFDGDPNSNNYSFILDKVWYGVLSAEQYDPIRSVLSTKELLIEFINIFADQFDDSLCSDKIDQLIKNKKMLNELCKTGQTGAFVDDLSDKISAGAIQSMLDQDKQRLIDLLKAMKNLVDPVAPKLFCDSDSEDLPPALMESFLDPSTVEISRKTLQSSLAAAERTFESEIENFNIILTNKNEKFSNASQLFDNVDKVGHMMKSLYGFASPQANENTSNYESDEEDLKSSLQQIVASSNVVGSRTLQAVNQLGNNLITSVEERESGPVITIALNIQLGQNVLVSGGEIVYVLNYSNEIYSAIPLENDSVIGEDGSPLSDEELLEFETFVAPLTAKLIYEREPNAAGDREFFSFSSELPPFSIQSNESNFFLNSNDLSNSLYDNKIKSLLSSHSFYGNVLEQIIKEHAEYITTQDLFSRSTFDTLQLTKQFACDKSLFDYQDIVGTPESYYEKAKKIGCKDGFGNVPAPPEKLNMYSVYESYVMVLTATEMLKSLFSFTSFGLQALMPEEGLQNQFSSFYFDYLIGEIEQGVYLSQPPVLNENLQKVLIEVYSALNNKDKNDVTIREVNEKILSKAIRKMQNTLYYKLARSGIPTKISDFQSLGGPVGSAIEGQFGQEIIAPESVANQQILDNILTAPQSGYIGPPQVLAVDFETGFIEIPPGFYSYTPRLANGGFYIEEGVEIKHKLKNSTNITEQTIDTVTDYLYKGKIQGYTAPEFKESVYKASSTSSLTSRYLFGTAPQAALGGDSLQNSADGFPSFIRDKKYSIDSNEFGSFLLDNTPGLEGLLKIEGYISYSSNEYLNYVDYFQLYDKTPEDDDSESFTGSYYLTLEDLIRIKLFNVNDRIEIYSNDELVKLFDQLFSYDQAAAKKAAEIEAVERGNRNKNAEEEWYENLTERVRESGVMTDALDKKIFRGFLQTMQPYSVSIKNKLRFGIKFSSFGFSELESDISFTGDFFDDFLTWDILPGDIAATGFPGVVKLFNEIRKVIIPSALGFDEGVTQETLPLLNAINGAVNFGFLPPGPAVDQLKNTLRQEIEAPLIKKGYDLAWSKFQNYRLKNPKPSYEKMVELYGELNAQVFLQNLNHPWFLLFPPEASGIDAAFQQEFFIP